MLTPEVKRTTADHPAVDPSCPCSTRVSSVAQLPFTFTALKPRFARRDEVGRGYCGVVEPSALVSSRLDQGIRVECSMIQ